VKEKLDALHYTGPVGLACNDTKLFSQLRLIWDSKKAQHYLVGGVNGPILVSDPDKVGDLMKDKTIVLGTKVD